MIAGGIWAAPAFLHGSKDIGVWWYCYMQLQICAPWSAANILFDTRQPLILCLVNPRLIFCNTTCRRLFDKVWGFALLVLGLWMAKSMFAIV